MIALCLYYGLTTKDVDNWGHIGGLLMEFVMAIILYRRKRQSVDFMEDSLYT
jgi:membrane associated rhomboid family serine protease